MRALADAGEAIEAVLEIGEEREHAGRDEQLGRPLLRVEIERVEVEPQLGRDVVAQRDGVVARDVDAAANRIGIVGVEREEIEDRSVVGGRVGLGEQLALAENREQRRPRLRVARRALDQQMVVDVEQARAPFGPFQIARSPEKMTRDSPEHQASSTQVSLLPPPCEEFTINEPSRSATRVSPPASTRGLAPSSTKGRKSICRGDIRIPLAEPL